MNPKIGLRLINAGGVVIFASLLLLLDVHEFSVYGIYGFILGLLLIIIPFMFLFKDINRQIREREKVFDKVFPNNMRKLSKQFVNRLQEIQENDKN